MYFNIGLIFSGIVVGLALIKILTTLGMLLFTKANCIATCKEFNIRNMDMMWKLTYTLLPSDCDSGKNWETIIFSLLMCDIIIYGFVGGLIAIVAWPAIVIATLTFLVAYYIKFRSGCAKKGIKSDNE